MADLRALYSWYTGEVLTRWMRRTRGTTHPGSKRRFNKARARRRDKLARESRRRNRAA